MSVEETMKRRGARVLIRALVFLFVSVSAAGAYVSSGGEWELLRSAAGIAGNPGLSGASDTSGQSAGEPFGTRLTMSGGTDVLISGYLSGGLPPGDPRIYAVYSTSAAVAYGLVDAAGYQVDASTAANFTGTIYSSVTPSVSLSTLAAANLTPNTTYYLRAGSLWNDGTTNYAFTTPVSTLTLAAIPGVPADPFTGVYGTSVTVNWLANDNPSYTEYQVQASTAVNFTGTLFGPYVGPSGWGVGVSTTVISLAGCTEYYFQVRARNGNNVETGFAVLGSTVTAGFYDCGVRYFDGTGTIHAACVSQSCPGGRLKISKDGTNHFIGLVDVTDPKASRLRIQAPEGVKAIRKYP